MEKTCKELRERIDLLKLKDNRIRKKWDKGEVRMEQDGSLNVKCSEKRIYGKGETSEWVCKEDIGSERDTVKDRR